MICQNCGKNPAQVHSVLKINDTVTDRHLCLECAQQAAGMTLNIGDFLADVIKGAFGASPEETVRGKSVSTRTCPRCGIGQADIVRHGRVGCAQCYTAFADVLGPMLQRIHGHAQHAGKRPAFAGEMKQVPAEAPPAEDAQVGQLRMALEEAILAERFEQAAELRDRIKALTVEGEGRA